MHINEYQALARRTSGFLNNDTDLMTANFTANINCAALGLAGEAGELADYIKKIIYHGHMLSTDKVIEELGDIVWYVAEMASALQLSLDDIAQHNISKLQLRYPAGFSQLASIERGNH